jgi:hypothetical protein
MSGAIEAVGAWPLLLVALAVYGFFPGLIARLISLAFSKDDPRRKELIAEVYAVPRLERPFWVAEQLERAITEGIWERASWAVWNQIDGRFVNKWMLGDGIERNAEYPDTFEIPTAEDIAELAPGDTVKLMFEAKGKRTYLKDGCVGERMWVKVTEVRGDKFVGELDNYPVVWNRLVAGDRIEFERKHIIDVNFLPYADEDAA